MVCHLGEFKKILLATTFIHLKEVATVKLRTLRNGELCVFISRLIIRIIQPKKRLCVGLVSRNRGKGIEKGKFSRETQGKGTHGKSRRRWGLILK